ncbi:MAG: aminotransferase class V-fold PLP-dependent enzyme [Proteobacteria bacterium]|nr:aminotransferase class V-fold PLP-dependent enzyme [Pseudomonadota bacterium]
MFSDTLIQSIRDQFHHVDSCPYQGPRIFFENAGGSLTLKSVVRVNAGLSAIPDNQGRDNPASKAMGSIIDKAKQDIKTFLGVTQGQLFIGETGTECLFRVIRAAVMGAASGGQVLGSTLEHPATVSACKRWAAVTGKEYVAVPHNLETANVSAEDYQRFVTADTRVATIIQTSPVTGRLVDVPAVVNAIRAVAPDCLIIVDGIQHVPHGALHVENYDVDAYAVSAYKVYSRHNYGIGWVSHRLESLPHDRLEGTPENYWEMGTRDAAAYACFSEVVSYLDWLGARFSDSENQRQRLMAASKAIAAHENHLLDVMVNGNEKHNGLADIPGVSIIGGTDNEHREGVLAITVENVESAKVVSQLSENGIRVHLRTNDRYSGNILNPLGLESCIRISIAHYNTADEVEYFLKVMKSITKT